jgi:CrcB protein
LWVGFGGFLGSIARYGLGLWFQREKAGATFPLATLVINALGCLLLGLLAGAASRTAFAAPARAFLFVGLLGGFTTFSAFGHETFVLLRDGRWPIAALSVALQIGLGVGAVWAGLAIASPMRGAP